MSKKLQLTIPKPCHENWDAMTPVEKGKFCGSCQKQVVDFSDMSDRQVAEFFKKPSTGSVCGRFMTDQLDRTIEIPKKRIPWVKYFFQFAIPAFLVSIKASAQKTQGKIKMNNTVANDTTKRRVDREFVTLGLVALPENLKPFKENKEINNQPKNPVEPLKGEIKVSADTAITPVKEPVCSREIMGKVSMSGPISKNEIEVRVVDEKGEPVPFASIETGKPGQGIIADENGIFRMKKNWLTKAGFIVSSTGFESKRVIAEEKEYSSGKLYVQLKVNVVLPEAIVNAYGSYRKGMVTGAYSVIRWSRGLPEIKKDPVDNTVIIYPNPVKSGTTMNLSFKKPEEGYYQLHILNQSGQMVQQKEIWIDAEARLVNIDAPSIPAGSYFLVLTNKKTGKKFTEKIVIQ